MKVLFEYSKGCDKHINQDIYGYKDNVFWVIDGATEVFGNKYLSDNGDVYWVVQQLNHALHNTDSSLSLNQYLRCAIKKMREAAVKLAPEICNIAMNRLPTYAICCVRYKDNILEYLCLGDCSVFTSRTPTMQYTDKRIEPFHLEVNEVKKRYVNDPVKYHIAVTDKVRKIKNYINVESGYWIGTLDPEVVDHAIYGKIEISKGDRFLICSDGFRPSIDEANLVSFNPSEIFNPTLLPELLNKQDIAEREYFSKTGIDISDDKTVLLVEL